MPVQCRQRRRGEGKGDNVTNDAPICTSAMLWKKEKNTLSPGKCFLRKSPPRLAKPRTADSLKSGFLDLGMKRDETIERAVGQAVRVLGGKAGQCNTAEASRRCPHGGPTINIGTVKNKVVPRLFFSKPIDRPPESTEPFHHQLRCDCDARFPFGTGPMALDEDNRIIHEWTNQMAEMADAIWKAMKGDKRFRHLAKPGNEFAHTSVHAHRAGNRTEDHEDRRRNRRNSMKRGTAVAALTVGGRRDILFERKCDEGGKLVTEEEPCCGFSQSHGSLFVLHPNDEAPKMRRDWHGKMKKDGTFVHGITTDKDKDCFSVAFVFRCVETAAAVDATTDRVVAGAPKNQKELARRQERAIQREADAKPNSSFSKTVEEVQDEWRRLMEIRGWMQCFKNLCWDVSFTGSKPPGHFDTVVRVALTWGNSHGEKDPVRSPV